MLSQHAALNKRRSYSSDSDTSSEEEFEEGGEYDHTVSNSLPAIGTKVNMVNNCPSKNTNGKFFLKGIKKGGWKIMNSQYRGDQRTHEDRSSDSFRCLDYIVTNSNKCTRVFVDSENIITPYRVMSAGPTPARRYTFKLEKRDKVSVGPAPPIIVRNEEGDARFRKYTRELAEQMLELLNSGSSILTVLKTVLRKIKEAKRQSYLRIRVTRIKRKMWSDNEAYMKLTRDLEAQAERVMNNKTNDKIFQMRGQRLLKERHEEVTSMFNDRGELVEDQESILDVLTQYNEKLLGIPDFEEIHRLKKRVVDTLDKTQIEDLNTLTPREFIRAIQRIQNKIKNKLYTDTLNELAMSAHPDKSVQVITGNIEWVKSIKAEFTTNPCILQGFPVKSTAGDKYLGMWFVEGTYRETIDKNIKVKHGLMQKAASEIRNMVDMPEIKRFGKSAAQKLLAHSQIVPICIYSTQAWINIEEDQYKSLEDSFRDSLATIMSVPKQTNYAALLKVNNLIYMENLVDMVKLKMWNYKYNVKASGCMFRVLQHKVTDGIKGGLTDDLMKLCQKYDLHNLFERELDPNVITRQCRQTSYGRQWRELLSLRSMLMMLTSDKVRYTFSEYPENLSRALIKKELGLLILKTTCPHQFLERNMSGPKDRTCIWAPLCTNTVDSYEHLYDCPYYTTKQSRSDQRKSELLLFYGEHPFGIWERPTK